MSIKKMLAAGVLGAGLFTISHASALASDGTTTMRSQIGTCDVSSGFFPDGQYHVQIVCGNLLTATSPENLRTIVWINPSNGTNPVRLGEIPYGKGDFKTKTTFSSIFVTQERDGSTKTPSSNVVMRGTMQPRSFLSSTPRPTQDGEPTEEASPTPAPKRNNILSFLRSGAVITVIAIFVILLMLILVKPFR